jgi:hypothetical protein
VRLTFKLERRVTGLAGIAHCHRTVFIKGNGKHVGGIYGPNAFSGRDTWEVRFTVKKTPTSESPSDWKWVTLAAKPATAEDARALVTRAWDTIQAKFNLHQLDMEDY